MTKRRDLWILLFVLVAVLLSLLAMGWNLELIRNFSQARTEVLLKMVLGTLGFLVSLTFTILLFIKLLKEMHYNQLQSEFLATVSHELKTPLASLQLASSLLLPEHLRESTFEKLSPAEAQCLWESYQIELDRLKNYVDMLLDAARFQTHPRIQQKNLHLESWLQNALPQWRMFLGPKASLQRTGEPLSFEVPVNLPALELIINNLLSNVKKFSKEIPELCIHTQILPKTRYFKKSIFQIYFKDQGLGFPSEDAKKIFQRFYRSSTGSPHAIPGTGLGLYLASSASKAIGMRLQASSEGLGHGATFLLEGSRSQ